MKAEPSMRGQLQGPGLGREWSRPNETNLTRARYTPFRGEHQKQSGSHVLVGVDTEQAGGVRDRLQQIQKSLYNSSDRNERCHAHWFKTLCFMESHEFLLYAPNVGDTAGATSGTNKACMHDAPTEGQSVLLWRVSS
jgi:hypothetical protein